MGKTQEPNKIPLPESIARPGSRYKIRARPMTGHHCPHMATVAISYGQLEVGALHLSREDRAKLASRFLESLEIDGSLSADELQIFNRRSLEIHESTVKPLTFDELQRDVAARLA
ncbi:MAG: addiction module protein [Luteolibacter sp.]